MNRTAALALLIFVTPVSAQVYRWVDEQGTVHYSNAKPPPGVKATLFDPDAKAGPPSAESTECYTVRCQGERELLAIAGAPDLLFSDVFAAKNYTYLPTSGDPFTTTITVIGGRINHIERVRKF